METSRKPVILLPSAPEVTAGLLPRSQASCSRNGSRALVRGLAGDGSRWASGLFPDIAMGPAPTLCLSVTSSFSPKLHFPTVGTLEKIRPSPPIKFSSVSPTLPPLSCRSLHTSACSPTVLSLHSLEWSPRSVRLPPVAPEAAALARLGQRGPPSQQAGVHQTPRTREREGAIGRVTV